MYLNFVYIKTFGAKVIFIFRHVFRFVVLPLISLIAGPHTQKNRVEL